MSSLKRKRSSRNDKGKEKEDSGNSQSPKKATSPTMPTTLPVTTKPTSGSAGTFRLTGAQLFLTYPQCSLTKEEALDLLTQIAQDHNRSIVSYVIATEKHADGNDHLHAYLKLSSGWNNKDPTSWDLRTWHGNYQAVRSPAAVKKYCQKEGDFIQSADVSISPQAAQTPWKKARETAATGDLKGALEALEGGNERVLRDLTLYNPSISSNLRSLAPPAPHPKAVDLATYGDLFSWDKAKHTLVLFGETNKGKTTLAESLLPLSLLTRHLDRLGELKPGFHEGFILDDMSFSHLHDEAQIALLDIERDSQVHVRYRIAHIPAGTPRIITTNKIPFEILNLANPAIRRRVQCVRWYGWDAAPMWREEMD
nr:replication-associated protein [Tick-associated circular DNA virus]